MEVVVTQHCKYTKCLFTLKWLSLCYVRFTSTERIGAENSIHLFSTQAIKCLAQWLILSTGQPKNAFLFFLLLFFFLVIVIVVSIVIAILELIPSQIKMLTCIDVAQRGILGGKIRRLGWD